MAKQKKSWMYSPARDPKAGASDATKAEVERKAKELIETALTPRYVVAPPKNPEYNYVTATAGDPHAAADLLPLVYDELRKLAATRMAAESPGHSLDATALVHEAYLRLIGDQQFDGRGHFFAAAAEAMRRILVDAARRKRACKHGGDRRRVDLPDLPADSESADERILSLDAALTRLADEDPEAARVVELRHFAGLSIEEAATALGVSRATAYRQWTYARAWLRDALPDDPD